MIQLGKGARHANAALDLESGIGMPRSFFRQLSTINLMHSIALRHQNRHLGASICAKGS
jgi:hypothetical protein